MPRKPKSVTSEAPLAPIPAEILEQFVLDLPRGRAGTLGRPPWTSSQFSTGIASRRQPRRMTRSGREWDVTASLKGTILIDSTEDGKTSATRSTASHTRKS